MTFPTIVLETAGPLPTLGDKAPSCQTIAGARLGHGQELEFTGAFLAGAAAASAIHALINLSLENVLVGEWDSAQQLADEGLLLCEDHGLHALAWPLWLGQAIVAAGRGEVEKSETLADAIDWWASTSGAGVVQLYARYARTLAALGQCDFEDAYQQAVAISPPSLQAPREPLASWIVMDLVESAVRTNRRAEGAAYVTAVLEANTAVLSPRLALLAAGAAAIVAREDSAAELFDRALAIPGADRWLFDYARVQLAYGEHLRRARSVTESRTQITEAVNVFQGLDARPWVARANIELRATAQSRSRAADDLMVTSLTPQEREIAMLAAAGLTNKQIGERLFLSHRTVGAHLYRVFPKLRVTSRAALRDALNSLTSGRSDEQRN